MNQECAIYGRKSSPATKIVARFVVPLFDSRCARQWKAKATGYIANVVKDYSVWDRCNGLKDVRLKEAFQLYGEVSKR